MIPLRSPEVAPPRPERTGNRVLHRDALVAAPVGYRPLLLDLAVPDAPGARPVVAFLYGGAFAVGSHKHGPLGDHVTERLLDAGFAVARVQYRHSREAVFPAQLHDVKAAVRWLRHHAGELGLDAARIAAWGHAAGGHLAAMLAVTAEQPGLDGDIGVTGPDSAVAAAIAWSPPTDFTRLPRPGAADDPHDWLLGGPVRTKTALAATASPLTHVEASAAPLQLVHGTDDTAVPIAHSEALVAAYWRAGADADLVRVENAGHFFSRSKRDSATDAGIAFLRRHL